MSGQISQDAGVASSAQNDMADAVAAIRAKINAVTDAVDAAKAGWQGDAFAACNAAANGWDEEASALNRVLDELQQEVGTGRQHYTGMEGDNTQLFTSLGAAMPS
jgi:WXG100 family type VII secretion target